VPSTKPAVISSFVLRRLFNLKKSDQKTSANMCLMRQTEAPTTRCHAMSDHTASVGGQESYLLPRNMSVSVACGLQTIAGQCVILSNGIL